MTHILLAVYFQPVLRLLYCIGSFNLYNNQMWLVVIGIIPILQGRKQRRNWSSVNSFSWGYEVTESRSELRLLPRAQRYEQAGRHAGVHTLYKACFGTSYFDLTLYFRHLPCQLYCCLLYFEGHYLYRFCNTVYLCCFQFPTLANFLPVAPKNLNFWLGALTDKQPKQTKYLPS
jgi:hypothetical protein